jgi:hypothetical protein
MPGPACADAQMRGHTDSGRFSEDLLVEYIDQQRTLRQTGNTVRRQLFLQIYAMAHYLEGAPLDTDASVYSSVIDAPGIKQITMIFLRSLSAEQIQESLSSGLKANASSERYERIRPDIAKFMAAINDDVRRSDEFVLRWYPDGTMDAFFQGDRISSISNAEFAKTMWAIWFGEDSVVDRAALVTRLQRAHESR